MNNRRLFIFLFGLGCIIRVSQINTALWYDEAFSAWLSGLPLVRIVAATAGDVHPPLYYFVLWGVNHALGGAEWALRLPSLLAGLVLVFVVMRLGRSLGMSSQQVTVAAVITLFSPFQIYYSQEARFYALLTLAVALAALGLVERRWWLAIVGSLAALYLHNLAVLFVGAVWLAAYSWYKPAELKISQAIPKIIKAGVIVAIGFLPAMIWTLYQAGNVGQAYWIVSISSPGRIVATFDDLLFFTPSNPFVFATAMVTSITLILVLIDVPASIRGNTKFLLISVFLPLCLVILASYLWRPVLITRVMAPIAPFFYLLIAWSVTQTERRLVTWSALAGPVAACVIIASIFSPSVGRRMQNEEVSNIYDNYRPGDGIYHANTGTYVSWNYYLGDIPQYVWPQDTTLDTGLSAQTRQAMGMNEAKFEDIKCERRWWLVYYKNPVTRPEEMAYVDHLMNDYHSTLVKQLRQDITADGALVLLEPDCSRP